MAKNEQVFDVSVVKEADLPKVISDQYTKLKKLEDSVLSAVEKAKEAKGMARTAGNASAGLFHKREAIELLQDATKGLADAQITAVEAQKISFEYQTKLTEITKFLFALGVSNIAMNRSVVRELELKLRGASDTEISALAKQELQSVIMQLKAQEDIMMKQESLAGKMKAQGELIKEFDKQIDEIEEQDEEQDKQIAKNAGQIKELDKQIDSLEEQDEKQDKQIAKNAGQIKELDKQIDSLEEQDEEQDKKIQELDKQIDDLEEQDEIQDEKIAKNAEKITKHAKALSRQIAKDEEHDRKLDNLEEQDEEHDKRLDEHAAELEKQQFIDAELERKNSENAEKIALLQNEIAQLANKNAQNEQTITALYAKLGDIEAKANNLIWKIVPCAFAALALVLSVIGFVS